MTIANPDHWVIVDCENNDHLTVLLTLSTGLLCPKLKAPLVRLRTLPSSVMAS